LRGTPKTASKKNPDEDTRCGLRGAGDKKTVGYPFGQGLKGGRGREMKGGKKVKAAHKSTGSASSKSKKPGE